LIFEGQTIPPGVVRKGFKNFFVMKKIRVSVLVLGLMFIASPIVSFSQGLPPCSGGVLVSGGPGSGQASVYDCWYWVQVLSASLPGGGCAGAHRDCSTTPPTP